MAEVYSLERKVLHGPTFPLIFSCTLNFVFPVPAGDPGLCPPKRQGLLPSCVRGGHCRGQVGPLKVHGLCLPPPCSLRLWQYLPRPQASLGLSLVSRVRSPPLGQAGRPFAGHAHRTQGHCPLL